jgi:predicted ATPase
MAPEQLADNHYSESGDWYSVGVLLYQVLTGRLPFQGNNMRVLINKVSTIPPAPHVLLPGVPEDLSRLAMDLLRPKFEDHPAGSDVLERLEARQGQGNARAHAHESTVIEREREMNTLMEAFGALQEGKPVRVNLHGASGMGKSFLLRGFKRSLQKKSPRTLILSGRCYEQEQVPFKALDGIVDALSHHLKQLPSSLMEPLLPRNAFALAMLFPVLQQVPLIADSLHSHVDIPDAHELRRRAFDALRTLLARMCGRHPMVIIIDDLQWGDLDSAALLSELMRAPDPPLLLVITGFRSEETGTSPVLKDLLSDRFEFPGKTYEVELREFSHDQSYRLAKAMLGTPVSDGHDLAERIAQ